MRNIPLAGTDGNTLGTIGDLSMDFLQNLCQKQPGRETSPAAAMDRNIHG
jgi:hypothetical protein